MIDSHSGTAGSTVVLVHGAFAEIMISQPDAVTEVILAALKVVTATLNEVVTV